MSKYTVEDFEKDCIKACCECPQYRVFDDDDEINDIEDIVERVVYWDNEDTLWRSGYSVHLSDESQKIFHILQEEGRNGIRKYFGQGENND